MDKPTKPTISLTTTFGDNGIAFDSGKITNGYNKTTPDIVSGDNLNYLISQTGKGINYCKTIADFINDTPIGKMVGVDSSNKLVYIDQIDTSLLAPKASPTFTGTVTVPDGITGKQAINISQFNSMLTENGYRKTPDKNSPTGYFIEQWGKYNVSTSTANIVFPISFPNVCLGAYLQVITDVTTSADNAVISSINNTGMTIYVHAYERVGFWRSIGY